MLALENAMLLLCLIFFFSRADAATTTVLYHIVNGQRVRVSNGNFIEFQAGIISNSGTLYAPEESFVIVNEGSQVDNFALITVLDSHFEIPGGYHGRYGGPGDVVGVLGASQEYNFRMRFNPVSGFGRIEQQYDFNNGQYNGGVSFDVGANIYGLQAEAGPDQSVNAGDVVNLHGSGYYPSTATFRWSLMSWPAGTSQPYLVNPYSTNASFVASSPGPYVARFSVIFNGFTNSDHVTISAIDPRRPEVVLRQTYLPGGDRTIYPGDTVDFGTAVLNGSPPSKSFSISNVGDATLYVTNALLPSGVGPAPPIGLPFPATIATNSGAVGFEVEMDTSVERQMDGNVSIYNNSTVNPFQFHLTGRVVRLQSNAGPDRSVRVPFGGQVSVDGSGSVPLNDPEMTFHWSFLTRPPGSMATFANPSAKATYFVPDASGNYTVQLTVGLAGGQSSDTALLGVQRGQTLTGTVGVKAGIANSLIFGLSPGILNSTVPRGLVVRNIGTGETRWVAADTSTGQYSATDLADGTYSLYAVSETPLGQSPHFISDAQQVRIEYNTSPSPIGFVMQAALAYRPEGTTPISVVEVGSLLYDGYGIPEMVRTFFVGGAAAIPGLLQEEMMGYLVEKVLERVEQEWVGHFEVNWVVADTWNPQTGAAEVVVVSERVGWVKPGAPTESFFERTSKDAVWTTAHSPVSLVIEDPSGRRLGRDELAGVSYFDLVGGYEDSGDEKDLLLSEEAVAQYYRLYVYGLDTGTYSLDVRLFRSFPVATLQLTNISTVRGQVDVYYIGSPSTTNGAPALRQNHAPGKPTTISMSSVGFTNAVLSWGKATDPDGDPVFYEIRYAESGTTYFGPITTNTAASLSSLKPHTSYSIEVRARDPFGGASDWNALTPAFTTLNHLPTVSITSPTNGGVFITPQTLAIAVNATDLDGTVTNVSLYLGGIKLCERRTAPYLFVLPGMLPGEYSLSAVATDDVGGAGASGVVAISVHSNDFFVDRKRVTGAVVTTRWPNELATAETGEPNHAGGSAQRSLWWSWTPDSGGWVTCSTYGSTFDTRIAVYRGTSVSALELVAANDDDGELTTSRVCFGALAGVEYQIAVDGYDGAMGDVVLTIVLPSAGTVEIFTANPLPNARVGTPFSQKFEAAGDCGGYSWSLLSGAMPSGLRLGTDGILGGIPAVAGSYGFALRATGVGGLSFVKTFDMQVSASSNTPANDLFANAKLLSGVEASDTGSNAGASSETGEPEHAGSPAERSVWWVWTAPQSGHVTIGTHGSGFDTRLAIYAGTGLANLQAVAANDDYYPDHTSRVRFDVVESTRYFIAVDGYEGDAGTIQLSVVAGTGPGNDDLVEGYALMGGAVSMRGNNIGATQELVEAAHTSTDGQHSVWWTWTAPDSGPTAISTTGTTFDTMLWVFAGDTMASLQYVASDDDSGPGLTSVARFTGTAGTTYRIVVDGYLGDEGNIWVSVNQVAWGDPPRITSASSLPGGMRGANYDMDLEGVSAAGPLAWSVVDGTQLPPGLGMNLDGKVSGLPSAIGTFSFRARATDTRALHDERDFTVSFVGAAGAPANDLFVNAAVMGGSSSEGVNVSATKEVGEPNHADAEGGKSVWWKWMVGSNGWFRVSTEGSGFDTLLGVYTGDSLASLRVIGSSDDVSPGNTASAVCFFATWGNWYYFAVDGYAGDEGLVKLSISPIARIPTLLNPAKLGDGSFGFTIFGVAGYTYAVEGSSNLVSWTTLTNITSTAEMTPIVVPTIVDGGCGFYRVVVR